MFKRAVMVAAALLSAVSGTAFGSSFTITTPAGLNPGDQFFVVFATSTTSAATSTAIGTYDTFVTGAAAGVTYNGAPLTWKVYGLTHTDNNITSFFTGSAPVYLLNGTKIATTAASFVASGPSATPFLTLEEDGATVTPVGQHIWVGQPFGNELGSFAPQFGIATDSGSLWGNGLNTQLGSQLLPLYGFAEITVTSSVPEPATLTLLAMGIGGLIAARVARRG